jgi:disulfide bond formation protein DsbB
MVLRGSGSCADIQWQFLGLSIPAWTLFLFVVLTLIALVQLFRPVERRLF